MPVNWKLAIWGIALCFGLVACSGTASVSAFEIESDDATIVSLRKHVQEHHDACDAVRCAHILFEDELVLVVDLFCDDGAGSRSSIRRIETLPSSSGWRTPPSEISANSRIRKSGLRRPMVR